MKTGWDCTFREGGSVASFAGPALEETGLRWHFGRRRGLVPEAGVEEESQKPEEAPEVAFPLVQRISLEW